MIFRRQTHSKVSLLLYHTVQIKVQHQKHLTKLCVCIYTILYMCLSHPGNVLGCYKVHFTLEIICEPAAPNMVINVQCTAQVSSENILAHLSGCTYQTLAST